MQEDLSLELAGANFVFTKKSFDEEMKKTSEEQEHLLAFGRWLQTDR